jgi:hypothetical protein
MIGPKNKVNRKRPTIEHSVAETDEANICAYGRKQKQARPN